MKRPLRLWSKMQKPQYSSKIRVLEDVETVIDDIVGVRIVCNNLSDITFLQGILESLPSSDVAAQFSLALEPGSQKMYVNNPKPSGYRAYHVNLITIVPGLGEITRVRGELQVRTLLQDGWGELTHEDTYKPGVPLPPLVETLAKRMADLLATVDDLAQDIRLELDRLAQTDVESEIQAPHQPRGDEDGNGVPLRDGFPSPTVSKNLVLEEAARIVGGLERPAPLASLAAQLRAVFGAAPLRTWMGYPNFKSLLMDAVPDVNIVNVGPGYVIPRLAVPSADWPAPLRETYNAESE
ncbi:GTP pyrophosphokinase [Micromonospora viridifaciens]|uniref:GTP pyrophosphokinase n=1 Tax=Micromonospora viridifaciens TaxID=1881 RepID=UPI0038B29290